MAQFDLQKLRDIANEGIARHGLRGYARKLGLDVSTVRSLRDGRDMQVSKMLEIVTALGLSIEIRQTRITDVLADQGATSAVPHTSETGRPDSVSVAFHCEAPQAQAAHVVFDPGWLAAQNWNVQCLRWIVAPKTASAICVAPGALCLLDCSEVWPDDHAVWAYLENGALRVGYLNRPEPGTLLISGRDPAQRIRHLTGPALDAVTPLGRVVWCEAIPDGRYLNRSG